jgi:hypothetical protein
MSRFRVNEEYDPAADLSDESVSQKKHPWRVRCLNGNMKSIKFLCSITGVRQTVSCGADALQEDTSGVALAGRQTHLDDSVAITESTLIDMEMGINGRNNHDAQLRTIAQSRQSNRNYTTALRRLYGTVVPEDAVILRS